MARTVLRHRRVEGEAHSYAQLRRCFLTTVREERCALIASLKGGENTNEEKEKEKEMEVESDGAAIYKRACTAAKERLLARGVPRWESILGRLVDDWIRGEAPPDGGGDAEGWGGDGEIREDGEKKDNDDSNSSEHSDDNGGGSNGSAGAAVVRARRRSRFVEVRDPVSGVRRSLAAARKARAAAYRAAYPGATPLERDQIRRGVVFRPGISIFSRRKIRA